MTRETLADILPTTKFFFESESRVDWISVLYLMEAIPNTPKRGCRAGMFSPERILARLLSKVRVDEKGCWVLDGSQDPHGYINFGFRGKTRKAHAVSHALVKGEPGKGMDTMHDCDNPPCVNPDHLQAGTRQRNMQDCKQRGRSSPPPRNSVCGELNPQAKLSDAEVQEIRSLRAAGLYLKDIASKFNVSPSHVWGICKGTERRTA